MFWSLFYLTPNRCGIDEDPVTGSAHCALAHYWFPKLKPQFFVDHIVSSNVTSNTEEVILNSSEEVNVVNLEHLIGYQASKRGGIVKVAIDMNSSDRNKVLLNGNCITIMKSVILI